MELNELQPHQNFHNVHALVVKKTIGTTKTGRDYADIILRSGSATLNCKKWNYTPSKYDEILTVGAVVEVSGKTDVYQGTLQGNLDTIQSSDRSPIDFALASQFNIEAMYSDIMAMVHMFTEPLPKYVVTKLLTKYKKEFCESPAALGVHQAWLGGLIEHTYNMISIALPIIGFYQSRYGVHMISQDKVLFGVIMHDFGKIFEYDCTSVTFKMAPSGILANHIVYCPIYIHEAAMEWYEKHNETTIDFNFELEKAHLLHLVASHHGTQEFGSPVVPASLEAVLLHQIDLLDSKFMQALEHAEGKAGDVEGFSARSHRVQYLQPIKPEILHETEDEDIF